MISIFLFHALFLSANGLFVIFYLLSLLSALAISAILNGVTDMASITDNIDLSRMHYLPIGIVVFWVLQKRELKRFFEQKVATKGEQTARRKQEQMTHVLDC